MIIKYCLCVCLFVCVFVCLFVCFLIIIFLEIHEVRNGIFFFFFFYCALRLLIGWAGKLGSHAAPGAGRGNCRLSPW